MKTYDERIEELRRNIIKLNPLTELSEQNGDVKFFKKIIETKAKIEQLNELRKEVIEEVKELYKSKLEQNFRKGIIDYLKSKWNIKEEELK